MTANVHDSLKAVLQEFAGKAVTDNSLGAILQDLRGGIREVYTCMKWIESFNSTTLEEIINVTEIDKKDVIVMAAGVLRRATERLDFAHAMLETALEALEDHQ